MPPIYVKGGVWTNVEDQILKAAVSKYGLTQWSRVASLLPKKTAKQAKARWAEYLNPSIDRSTWTNADDDKLLSLAKLLPNQWRTVSLVMGRTATDCVERYQKLLESAAKRQNSAENGSDEESEDEELAEMKLSGPGIEALPALGNAFESLPARADAENMEDDDQEMLSEAKSRLANTQGKKAKRKDRDRMLEESRRVALLQKRRELKAAGIKVSLTLKNKKIRQEFDYNADIPHERQPQRGLYDVLNEEGQNEEARLKFQRDVNRKGIPVEGPQSENEKKGKKETAKAKAAAASDSRKAKENTRLAAEMVSSIDAAQQAKRRKLDLPDPGENPESDGVRKRVLEKSRELLSAQNAAQITKREGSDSPEVSSRTKLPTEIISLQKLGPATPVSRRKISSALRSLFASVPRAKKSTEVVMPKFDRNEGATILRSTEGNEFNLTDDVNTDDFELLSKADIEKTHSRRSQIFEKGLQIPSLEVIDLQNTDNSEVAKEISKELRKLVRNDLAQGENGMEAETEPIDEKMITRIESLIEKETMENYKKDSALAKLPNTNSLPTLLDAVNKVYDLLHALDASANAADQKLNILEDARENEQQYEEVSKTITERASDLFEATLQEKVLEKIMWAENVVIERRSALLHELVKDIKAAETRVAL